MQSSTGTNSAAGSQACAVCKYQRRKCSSNCLLAPFFPANRHKDFLNTRKLFGVKNITKLIENLDFQQRVIAIKSIIFEANVKAKDPVGGCYSLICQLNRQIDWYKAELDLVFQQLVICKAQAMFTQYQQQSGQKQVVDNDLDQVAVGQSLEGFNMYNGMGVHDQHYQEDEGNVDSYGGSSSLLPVCNVFDSNFVKVELESSIVSVELEASKQVLSDVGEDIKPLLALFDDKREQTFSFDSGGSKIQCSDKLVSKEGAGSIQHQLKHDLNDAASLFTLTNSKG